MELGRATYAASRLAGITFDILRVHGGEDSAALYDLTHGQLHARLRDKNLTLPGIHDFLDASEAAIKARNDLLHALPVAYGLHRRRTRDPFSVQNFFEVEPIAHVTQQLEEAAHLGNQILYWDGGKGVNDWYAKQ